MKKHTPGPWKVGYEAFDVHVGNMKICDIRGWGHLTGTGGLNLPPEEAEAIQKANASLISAAPEMLEVLRALILNRKNLNEEHFSGVADKLFGLADAAVKKAVG